MKRIPNHRFINWAGNQNSQFRELIYPETGTGLADSIRNAGKVRILGSGHSWSGLCTGSEVLLSLDQMQQQPELDSRNELLTVSGGMKLKDISRWLDERGYALPNLGSIDAQSIAGAIATATHGSGLKFGILADMVQEFEFVKADGSIQTINREHQSELFNLTVVNLALLGVMSRLTIKVVPAFRLREESRVCSWAEAFERMDEWLTTTDHLKLWWFPHTDKLVVYRYFRTSDPVNDSRLRQWFMDEFLSVGVFRSLAAAGNLRPAWRPAINHLLASSIRPLNRTEKSHKVFRVPEPPKHRETEWAFPLSSAAALLHDYRNTINRFEHKLNFIQEIRFSRGDPYALSPCHGRDSIWLGLYQMDHRGWPGILHEFESLAKDYGGRPHWGKEFDVDSAYLKPLYPQWENFMSLRKEWDTENKFTNHWLEQKMRID